MPTYSTAQFRQYVVDLLQQATGLTISIPTILSTAEYRGLVVDLLTVLAQGGGGGSTNATQLQGRNISATAPTSGQVLAWNGTVWIPTSATGSGTVTSVALSGGTTGLTTSGGPITGSGTITLGGTLGVANGGTGATTLTGYVKGNGTAAFTASATISAADVSGALAATNLPALSGDLTSTAGSNSITVAKLRGQTVSATVPTSGQILKFDGTQWAPSTDVGITALTGDVTASGSGSVVATLSNTGVTASSYGSATAVPILTVDAKGRISAASNQTITPANIGAEPTITTLTVAKGGTGASTLTGYVKGNGTGAFTASATVAAADVSGILSASNLPALSGDVTTTAGAALTTVVALRGRNLAATAPTSGQVLGWNGSTSTWEPITVSGGGGGTVTSIIAGTGLSGGTITTSGTIAVTFGTTTGTVTQGGTTVLKAGDSMTGALSIALNTNTAGLSVTQSGNGHAFVIGQDSLVISRDGHLGIGITPNSSHALRVDTGGIFTQGGLTFGDNSVQTTAGITSLTGDVTTVGAGASAATVVALRGRSVASTAPTSGQVLAWDGTNWAPANSAGGGTVTSITAGTGLTGGTITTSGTIAVDFGTTTGKVTEGGTTVLKGGDTMTGKLTLPAATFSSAPINIGSSGVQPTSPATGDVWIRNNAMQYKGSSSTINTVAATGEPNIFSVRQTISATDNTTAALRVTQLGTGEAFRVEDEANPDATAFVVSASGRVGIGVTPDTSACLSVDSTGIKFSNGSTQTVAGITALTSDVTASGSGSVASTVVGLQGRAVASTAPTSGQVLAWNGTAWAPTTGGGGGGITALTGDVTASGTGSVTATVAKLRGTLLSANTPINGQVLQYNATTQEWQPSSAAAGAIAMVAYTTVGIQYGVSLPAGYAWADIYVCSGAGGGGGGMDSMNGSNGGAAYGGGGGGAGLSEFLQKIPIDNATFEFEIGAGGVGGVGQSTYTGQAATDGGDGMPTYLKMNRYGVNRTLSDLGKYAEPAALNTTGAQGGNWGGGAGQCNLSFPASWRSTLTQGGNGTYGVGNPSVYTGQNNVGRPISVSGSSGAGISTTPNDGGAITNIKFPNLDYSTNALFQYQGKATSGAQDALPLPTLSLGDVDFNSLNFLGGAGGASGDISLNIPLPSPMTGYRAGNGADGHFGCGGGGGGAIGGTTPDTSNPYYGGDGGDGGQGFIIFICYN